MLISRQSYSGFACWPRARGANIGSYTLRNCSGLTLAFTTESGYTAAMETLGVETAPVTLLAAEAMTGATPISFSAPKAE